jgi:uncharacterized Tic20 family protein
VSVDDELDALRKLRDAGTITDEQYERARRRLLNGEPPEAAPVPAAPLDERHPRRARDDFDDEYEERRPRRARRKRVRDWAMVLHLSLLAGHTVPLGGLIAPIVIWQTQKDEMPELDPHGKNAANWVLTFLLGCAVFGLLSFVLIGIPFLAVLLVLNVVFPVIAAVKASEDRVWRYPLSITFFK